VLDRKILATVLALSLLAIGSTTYVAFAANPAGGAGDEKPLIENIKFADAVLVGAHKSSMPAVVYGLVAYGPRHTTILAYGFAFVGIAEVSNETLVASAGARNTTWANSDFHIIEHDGRPIGLAMGFRNEGPLYVEFAEGYGESGYYDMNITVVLMAFYHPRLEETILARVGSGDNSTALVAYDVRGGVVLAAAFKIEGWPSEIEGTRLVVGFGVLLRAFSWLETREGRIKADVVAVSPFCGSTRPRLERESGLIRGTFAFVNKAIVKNGDGKPEIARAFCLYQVRGWLLKLGIIVPKADVVGYPARRR